MLYFSNLQPVFERDESDSAPVPDPHRIAFELLELTNHVPPAYVTRPDLVTTTVDTEDPDWIVLDVDELPRSQDAE